jgi:hypothetical protein
MEIINRLFRIKVLHGAPKDSHTSTETYLVAENEQQVFDWINFKKNYGGWSNDTDEPRICHAHDDYEKEISFQEWIMLNRGDLEDESGWEDAYYGVTKWGWEPVEATEQEIEILVKLGIAEKINS